MADYGLDADEITRWVIRKSYGVRRPSPDQIARYRHWHAISRGPGGFTESGPWERWLARLIPPDAVEDVQASATLPPETPTTPEHELKQPAPPKRRRGRPRPRVRIRERAETMVREQLANGPRYGEFVIAAAAEVAVSERSLIAAADRLGVRCRWGVCWLRSGGGAPG
jgi:hypothetical protein